MSRKGGNRLDRIPDGQEVGSPDDVDEEEGPEEFRSGNIVSLAILARGRELRFLALL